MAGGGSSSSTPVDMTPQAFKNLQQPLANTIASLLGYAPSGTGGSSGGSTSGGVTGSSGSSGASSFWNTLSGTNPAQSQDIVPVQSYQPPQEGAATQSYVDLTRHNGSGNNNGSSAYTPATDNGTYDPNSVLSGIPTYSGDLVAPLSSTEQAYLDQLNNQQGSSQSATDQSMAYLSDVLSGKYLPGGDNSNPFLQAAIEAAQRPTMQALQETLSRTLPGRFTQNGQFTQPTGSSAFDRAAALAARDAQQTAADIATNMSYNAYNSERTAQGEAATTLPQISQQEITSTISNLQAQALPRLIQEMGVERGVQQFNNSMNQLMVLLQTAGGVTQPVVASSSESSQKPNIMPMFSDRRLKTDVIKVGTTVGNLPLYSYTIFNRGDIGVMADEVAAVMPEAVIHTMSGYDMVDYGRLIIEGLRHAH